MKRLMSVLVLGVAVLFAGQSFAATYAIDTVHSSIGFSIKHMMVSTVTGDFADYKGTINYDKAAPEATTADVTVEVKSINTRNEKRDAHLRGADFFDVEKFPTITFAAKSLTDGKLVGDLTMKGVTKEIAIPVTIEGPVKGMDGADLIGLSGQTTINRQDFGVTWNKTLEAGGLALGKDVIININIEAHAK